MGLDEPVWIQFWNFYRRRLDGQSGHRGAVGPAGADRGVRAAALYPGADRRRHQLVRRTRHSARLLGRGRSAAAWADRIVGVLSVAVIAVPSFVDRHLRSAYLRRARCAGCRPSARASRAIWATSCMHLILPSLAVGLGWVGYIARMVRASMLEVLEASHIRTAYAPSACRTIMITYRYALSIAILPTVTLLGVGIGQMLSSAVFAEIVFARPGVGKLVYDAILTRNFPAGDRRGAGDHRALRPAEPDRRSYRGSSGPPCQKQFLSPPQQSGAFVKAHVAHPARAPRGLLGIGSGDRSWSAAADLRRSLGQPPIRRSICAARPLPAAECRASCWARTNWDGTCSHGSCMAGGSRFPWPLFATGGLPGHRRSILGLIAGYGPRWLDNLFILAVRRDQELPDRDAGAGTFVTLVGPSLTDRWSSLSWFW